jgi:hypothetical protein
MNQQDRNLIVQALKKEIRAFAQQPTPIQQPPAGPVGAGSKEKWSRSDKLTLAGSIAVTVFGSVVIYAANSWIDNHIETKLHPLAENVGKLTERMTGVESKLEIIILRSASTRPNDPASQQDVVQTLEIATDSRIPKRIIVETGKSFVQAASLDSGAWSVALRLVDYRSRINAKEFTPPDHIKVVPKDSIKPMIPIKTGPNDHRSPMFSAAGRTLPAAEASYLKWEGKADPIYKTGYGAEYFIIDGIGTQDSIALDGATLRNVIFKNMVIIYDGGPLTMQNVTFENCTFQVIHSDHGVLFANSLLENNANSLALPS